MLFLRLLKIRIKKDDAKKTCQRNKELNSAPLFIIYIISMIMYKKELMPISCLGWFSPYHFKTRLWTLNTDRKRNLKNTKNISIMAFFKRGYAID